MNHLEFQLYLSRKFEARPLGEPRDILTEVNASVFLFWLAIAELVKTDVLTPLKYRMLIFDLDLDILCDSQDIKHYADILRPILGTSQKLSGEMAVWGYMQNGIEIDCTLSDPARTDSHIPKQKKVFEVLKTNSELRERYTRLKYECNGLPYQQYEAKKKTFLQEVEAL